MRAVLVRALADRELIDQTKKALMYGKDGDTIRAFRDATMMTKEMRISADYPREDFHGGLERLHAALGMRSEADEILAQELDVLCGRHVSKAERVDEIGDLGWYAQLYLNAIGISVLDVLKKNVAKLMKRYNGLTFNADRAKAPDREAEAAAQAGA